MSARVLIVDNNADSRGQLEGWLGSAGYRCVSAATADALPEARRDAPHVAFIGVQGLDDGGMWVVRTLRSQFDTTAVVLVANPPDFDLAVTANRLGVVDCLPGPPTRGAVIDAARRAALWQAAVTAARHTPEEPYEREVADQRSRLQETVRTVDADAAQSVLLAILEARTPDTHDHSQRVAVSAVQLAQRLGLDRADVRAVERAALLHDIGKIAIPPRLLSRAVSLTEDDIRTLQQHVTIGAEVLMAVPTLAGSAPVVVATHERFDGTGYPAGLVGEEIPLAARIIAVADTFDALTEVRSYRDPVSRDQANAELVRVAGTHLDPLVVRAWLGVSEAVRCS